MGRHAAYGQSPLRKLTSSLDRALANLFSFLRLPKPNLPKLTGKPVRFSYAFSFAFALVLVSIVDPYSGSIERASAQAFYEAGSSKNLVFRVSNYAHLDFSRGGFKIISGPAAAGLFVEEAAIPDAGSAKAYARGYISQFNWDQTEYSCLVALWERESNWRALAENSQSGAYGIPQALPGRKMASEGSDWQNNPETQIRWGTKYIANRYGTACKALVHSNEVGWY